MNKFFLFIFLFTITNERLCGQSIESNVSKNVLFLSLPMGSIRFENSVTRNERFFNWALETGIGLSSGDPNSPRFAPSNAPVFVWYSPYSSLEFNYWIRAENDKNFQTGVFLGSSFKGIWFQSDVSFNKYEILTEPEWLAALYIGVRKPLLKFSSLAFKFGSSLGRQTTYSFTSFYPYLKLSLDVPIITGKRKV
ncbi:MAG: hypothetical protein KDC92_13485 [Bacteroidetes bacterium]|nr:hypothetical protein [Bacteroidota bacterium]